MPTGYTAGILDGTVTTFPEFAKLCMRAFGATIHLRDESLDTEYKLRVPSDYHAKEIDKAKQSIVYAQKSTNNELVDTRKKELEFKKNYHLEMIEKAKKELDYHDQENIKEIEMCERSNKWVVDFLNSLENKL